MGKPSKPAKSKAALAAKAIKSKSAQKKRRSNQLSVVAAVVVLGVAALVGVLYATEDTAITHKKETVQQIMQRTKVAKCKNREDDLRCAKLVHSHGCDAAPGWMYVMCAASCGRCELLDPKIRCDLNQLNMSQEPGYRPGEMGQMFEGLQEKFPEYEVEYLSRPPNGPWIVSFQNFLNEHEIQTLINEVGDLKRSTDQGDVEADGFQNQIVSQQRTSSNAWCMGACEANPTVVGITERIEKVTGVPKGNYEAFQVLRYNLGEYYKTHHDMSEQDNNIPCGPRVLTFFLYLSDVEEGGGTSFTNINITMMPKKGAAILWPSVYDNDLTKQDPRTFHQALPVEKGIKYAANHWIHLYNYKIPNVWGCTGAFA